MKNNWILNLGILLSLALALVINPVAAEQLGDSAMLAQDGQINLPANALNFDKASTVITQYSTGLRWQATYLDGVFWETPRPIDWDGTSNVELRLYFLPMTSTVGNVDFFIRPRAYNPGDAFGDTSSISGTAVAVGQANQVRMQSFTIPAARFGAKSTWVITLQRGGSGETYKDDVVLMAVELRYTRQVATSSNTGVPANALNFDKASTVITQYSTGLRWQATYQGSAFWETPRPVDWDGSSNVELRLYFLPTTSAAGNVSFFIRPRAYDPGDVFADAASLDGSAVTVGQANQVRMQSFTIPATRFGAKSTWVISLQRGGLGETYTGDVVLMAVELRYTHKFATDSNTGLPANALNYDKASTVITQYSSGLRWQATYLDGAFWETPRPIDWDGASNVELRLYFLPLTSTAGNVSFFIRPRAYDPGDVFGDTSSISGSAVAVGQANQVRMQSFTIPAARFGAKSTWVVTLQRGGTGETYTGDVVLMAVELRYSPSMLTVSKSGSGSGTVTSNPAGINCGSTCSHSFAYNTVVTLTATPSWPSTFGGWSGSGCSGTGTCQVTMNAAKSVTATFNPGIARIYLPYVLKNYVYYFEGPQEMEPNNDSQTANGPLRSGVDYYGYPNDQKDYFSINLGTDGQIDIDLSNHTGVGVQLQLFYQVADVDHRVASKLDEPYQIQYNGQPGMYYIYIYTDSDFNSTTLYTLRVTYP